MSPATRRGPTPGTCALRFALGAAVGFALSRAALDGRISEPLPSILEEIFVIRPAGTAEAESAASAFAAKRDPLPVLRSTPVLGFNTWNAFGCNISEALILGIAHAMKDRGLLSAGYEYVGIDDCWQASERAADGQLQASAERFPSGIRHLAEQLHGMGFKLGIYSDYGLRTCAGYPGSYGHYEQDAATFASWGVDLLKFDRCAPTPHQDRFPARYYRQMAVALRATGRSIVFCLCNWGRADAIEGPPWLWAPEFAQQWRTTTDIYPSYQRVYAILQESASLAPFAAPGRTNDPDMLEVGVAGHLLNDGVFPRSALTAEESALHMSLWCMLSAPLLVGADVRSADEWVLSLLTNEEAIAINQDPLGKQASRVADQESGLFVPLPLVPTAFWGTTRFCLGQCRKVEVWVKPLVGHAAAVAFVNLGGQTSLTRDAFGEEEASVDGVTLGVAGGVNFSSGPHCVRDVRRRVDAEHIEAGVDAASFVLRRAAIAPRSHELLVVRPCACDAKLAPSDAVP